ncbi:MAG: flagellar biosynthetic protein FliQ [Candidatus Dadabacteria bacterium]|nr:MAG: flagellar biosynthetic protein FliQ [Candidatus Dadabacteria bacterium]
MGIDDYIRVTQVGLETALYVGGPILLLGLAAGLVVSIIQAATQINDSALAFIPKIIATFIGLVIFGNFMLTKMIWFTTWLYNQIPNVAP